MASHIEKADPSPDALLASAPNRVLQYTGLLIAIGAGYYVFRCIYNVYFHPLRHYPGPKFAAFSRIPYVWYTITGRLIYWIQDAHTKYGDVVRTGPNELSYINGKAWKDIYGHRTSGKPSNQKNLDFYSLPGDPNTSLLLANDHNHGRIRKIFSNAFSEQSLRQQEVLFSTYVDLLVESMSERVRKNPNLRVDMVDMYNFTTFDIMGDLTFGEPLYMIQNSEYTPWVKAMFGGAKAMTLIQLVKFFPLLDRIWKAMIPKSLKDLEKSLFKQSADRVDTRLAKETDRPDIWSLALREEGKGLTLEEMHTNAPLFMLAGTETTATLLSGLTYLLLKNPDKFKLLAKEIRDAFPSVESMSIAEMPKLKYLSSCLEEGLRMYPPVPIGLTRRAAPPEGADILGKFVPPNTIISVHHYSSYYSPTNFSRPTEFLPERWTSSEFDSDNKEVFQPFSFGPRNCIGKNLAYHEMRLIICKLLWHFDLTLCDESKDWIKGQKCFSLWDKPPLMVKVTPVQRK